MADTEFKSYSFYLTGATNSDGDWSNLSTIAPKATIAWTVKEHVDSYLDSTTMTADNLAFTIATDAPEIKSVMLTSSAVDGAFDLLGNNCCNITDNIDGTKTLTFTSYYGDVHSGGTITVTFDGGATETITIA